MKVNGLPDPRSSIRKVAISQGFDAVGFSEPQNGNAAKRLTDFLADGFHGDMGWMEATEDRRATPQNLWPEAKSVIVVGTIYGPDEDPLSLLEFPTRGAVSVYARGRDYHDVMKSKLRQVASCIADAWDCEVKFFVDTAPVLEKPLAQLAGVGWQGKHTNLVSQDFGSWLFLGEIFTTLELRPDKIHEDRCGSCQNCLDVCPTNAFPQPYRLDARRCISYLTIEHKGHIGAEFRAAIGNRIYGCDDCLAVCPWNKFAKPTPHQALRSHIHLTRPLLSDFALLNDDDFRNVFSGSPIKRLGRDRFVRNVLIAIGNSGDTGLSETSQKLLNDASPLVRAMAVWSLSQLLERGHFEKLRDRYLPVEDDLYVVAEWGGKIIYGDAAIGCQVKWKYSCD